MNLFGCMSLPNPLPPRYAQIWDDRLPARSNRHLRGVLSGLELLHPVELVLRRNGGCADRHVPKTC
jgi:hypothetical protein